MVDGAAGRYDLPHIVLPVGPNAYAYRPPRRNVPQAELYRVPNRQVHANQLSGSLRTAIEESVPLRAEFEEELRSEGLILAIEGWPGGFELALDRLDLRGAHIELLGFRPEIEAPPSPELATVYVPDGSTAEFFRRLEAYATEDTQTGRPRHEKLIANIASLRLAALRELWTDTEPFPADPGPVWWELWMRRTGEELQPLQRVAEAFQWRVAQHAVSFPTRIVSAVFASSESVGRALASRLPIAELRRARLIEPILDLSQEFQRELVQDARRRIDPAPEEAPAVCLLDTGIYQHSLLAGSLTTNDVFSVVSADGIDRRGHGTRMGGVALFGDLAPRLASLLPLQLSHRLESVKILPDGADANPPETYGAITASATTVPEAARPGRRRTYCMAVSAADATNDGTPSLWSATVDALAFGTDVEMVDGSLELLTEPDQQSSRLFIIAAGNVDQDRRADYLDVCDTSPIEDPGQSWNSLTVGAYTGLSTVPNDPDFEDYRTLAPDGELSPFSRTSKLYGRTWPIKPDIVMEGGNLLVSPAGATYTEHDSLALATTSRQEPYGQPLASLNMTSAAAAQAARLAAIVSSGYPELWPETVRGLLVHAAEWTEPMRRRIDAATSQHQRLQLMRRYGSGVPTEQRVLQSAADAVTLIAQAEMRPYERAGGRVRLSEMHLYELPWPREQLRDLDDAQVRLRVTLSYFVEPNPSSRGWRGRFVYMSHGLRFDVRRPTETTREFSARLNELARADDDERQPGNEGDDRWLIGPRGRSAGSIHADSWTGTAAEIADAGVIGVYPVGGWWKNNNRADRAERPVRYGLLVSLLSDEVETDLYTPIANQIPIPVEIEGP